jgi:hypothetical protein
VRFSAPQRVACRVNKRCYQAETQKFRACNFRSGVSPTGSWRHMARHVVRLSVDKQLLLNGSLSCRMRCSLSPTQRSVCDLSLAPGQSAVTVASSSSSTSMHCMSVPGVRRTGQRRTRCRRPAQKPDGCRPSLLRPPRADDDRRISRAKSNIAYLRAVQIYLSIRTRRNSRENFLTSVAVQLTAQLLLA